MRVPTSMILLLTSLSSSLAMPSFIYDTDMPLLESRDPSFTFQSTLSSRDLSSGDLTPRSPDPMFDNAGANLVKGIKSLIFLAQNKCPPRDVDFAGHKLCEKCRPLVKRDLISSLPLGHVELLHRRGLVEDGEMVERRDLEELERRGSEEGIMRRGKGSGGGAKGGAKSGGAAGGNDKKGSGKIGKDGKELPTECVGYKW